MDQINCIVKNITETNKKTIDILLEKLEQTQHDVTYDEYIRRITGANNG